jgi:uncharacterized protein YndB with AHSA1/START domain
MSTEKFVYVTYIASTPAKVWAALQEGDLMRQYWKHEGVSEWTPGAKWELVADDGPRTVKHVGRVLETVPEKRLVLSWADPADVANPKRHTRVAIDIETVGAMVRIALTHDELTEEMSQRIRYGWPLVLSSLKSFLETGEPLDILGTGTACSAASSSAASSTKPSRAAA